MKIISGNYADAKAFTIKDTEKAIDSYAMAQLQMLCDNEASKGCKIRVMPDVHPGKVCTIGLTMTVGERILPSLVGIDIGCGMTLAQVKQKNIEFQKLDKVIREQVPSGSGIRRKMHRFAEAFDRLAELYCYNSIREEKARLSLGTLGGGNHFIEIDKDDDGNLYVIIHTGSRHLGKEVTEYYLDQGQKVLKKKNISVPYELTYLDGTLKEQYLHDLQIVQEFAALNREVILDELVKGLKLKVTKISSCIHNYIEVLDDKAILRKGAISAKAGEPVIIPINMKDGALLGTGLGNEDWNCSAPHGAGRIMKREDISSHFTVSAFKSAMKGIYSSCIGKDTLDEAPFAYRKMDEILEVIDDTVHIETCIRPVYNFKAGNER